MKKLRHNQRQAKVSLIMLALLTQLNACHMIEKKPLSNHISASDVQDEIESLKAKNDTINDYLLEANKAWETEDFERLSEVYGQLLRFDPGNLRAEDGMKRIEVAKNHQQIVEEVKTLIDVDEASDQKALLKIQTLLLENPNHSQALDIYAQLQEKKAQRLKEKLNKKLAFNEPVSMAFRDVDIRVIFEGMSKTTNINFILDKDIPQKQKATIFVNNMVFNDALDLLLQTNKLAKKVLSDEAVIIYMDDPLRKRIYEDLSIRQYRLDYGSAKQVSTVLRSMLGINNIEVDERLNTLIIKDTEEVLDLAQRVIQTQDLPDPEVMLEVQILEVRTSYLQNLGVNPPTGVSLPIPNNGVVTIKDLKVSGNDLVVNGVPSLVFNAEDGDVSLLANPKIRVRNKETAKIHIGEKVPVFTTNVASTGVASQTVQYIDAGVKLELEPDISSTGDVTIKLNLNVGSIGDKVSAVSGGNESVAFRVGTRLTSTVLRLRDGETQVLAGLIDDQDRKNVSGIPGLSDIPLLGRLFSTQADNKVKTEIVFSITPRILREKRLPAANQSNMWIGTESAIGVRRVQPTFKKGQSPFSIPQPAPKQSESQIDEKPQDINIKLPKNFSLGNGLTE